MFIQTEATPNPATLKFLPGQPVLGDRVADFPDAAAAARSPLAARLFEIEGVAGVFFGGDFITVTRAEGAGEWQHLKPALLGAIMEHFTSGAPLMGQEAEPQTASAHADQEGENGNIITAIKELLDTRVRPAVAQDGGDITFQSYDNGIVYLHMQGSCAGCPAATMTLKNGVENMLRHYIPEVTEVRPV